MVSLKTEHMLIDDCLFAAQTLVDDYDCFTFLSDDLIVAKYSANPSLALVSGVFWCCSGECGLLLRSTRVTAKSRWCDSSCFVTYLIHKGLP